MTFCTSIFRKEITKRDSKLAWVALLASTCIHCTHICLLWSFSLFYSVMLKEYKASKEKTGLPRNRKEFDSTLFFYKNEEIFVETRPAFLGFLPFLSLNVFNLFLHVFFLCKEHLYKTPFTLCRYEMNTVRIYTVWPCAYNMPAQF